MVKATLWSSGLPIAPRVVHTLAPFPAYWREWSAALAAVGQSVRADGDGTMLMVGDFNATWGNRAFAALLHDELTDGAAARGKATDMTWPNGAVVPPSTRIDHILTRARLTVTEIAAKPGVRQRSPLPDRHGRNPDLSVLTSGYTPKRNSTTRRLSISSPHSGGRSR